MFWGSIASRVKSRIIAAIAIVNGINNAEGIWQEEEWEKRFQRDLTNCFNKSPSVIKTQYYELYHSSNGNVYAYMLQTGVRDIYYK